MKTIAFGVNAENEGELLSLPLLQLTHAHYRGMTGQGKSSLLAFLAASLIQQGVPVILLDPAGDLSRQVLGMLLETGFFDDYADAMEHVLYLDLQTAHEQRRYLPMNVLAGKYDAHGAASVVLEGFKRIWPELQDGSAINIDSFVHLGAYVLAEHKLPLIPHLTRLYSDPNTFKLLTEHVKDWHVKEQFRTSKVAPRANSAGEIKFPELVDTTVKRVNRLATSPLIRYPLAQTGNILDVETLLRDRRSVLLNLAVADQNAKSLLGALFTQHIAQTAMVYRPPEDAPPTVLIIDEVEDFVFQSGKALEDMFAQARKAGIRVWVAHQYGAQLSDDLNEALSQCATKVTFKTGYADALTSVDTMGFPYDPYLVKERTGNPFSPGGERTVYFSRDEQRAMWAGQIMERGPQEAFIQLPSGAIHKFRTLPIEGMVNSYRLKQLEKAYLERYFRPEEDIVREIERAVADLMQRLHEAQHDMEQPHAKPVADPLLAQLLSESAPKAAELPTRPPAQPDTPKRRTHTDVPLQPTAEPHRAEGKRTRKVKQRSKPPEGDDVF
jgi:hypothetical protein